MGISLNRQIREFNTNVDWERVSWIGFSLNEKLLTIIGALSNPLWTIADMLEASYVIVLAKNNEVKEVTKKRKKKNLDS